MFCLPNPENIADFPVDYVFRNIVGKFVMFSAKVNNNNNIYIWKTQSIFLWPMFPE